MINRRLLMRFFGLLGIAPSIALAVPNGVSLMTIPHPVELPKLKKWLDTLPYQKKASTTHLNMKGGGHLEIFVSQIARPEDVAMTERRVAQDMRWKVEDALYWEHTGDASYHREPSLIEWRIPLEWEINPTEVVVEYREDGPDKDFLTDRRCVMDRNWYRVAAYCRLSVF